MGKCLDFLKTRPFRAPLWPLVSPSILMLTLGAFGLGAFGACDWVEPVPVAPLVEPTWAQELGFPADAKALILHADDSGLAWEANEAAVAYLQAGEIKSTSVMVPVTWSTPFFAWRQSHPEFDVGLHLTLSSEFSTYRWGPIMPTWQVPTLLDPADLVHLSKGVPILASKKHVKKEVEAQIDRAIALGAAPTHLDSHMGTLFARPEFFKVYLEAAIKYQIPAVAFEDFETTLSCIQGQNIPGSLLEPVAEALRKLLAKELSNYPYPRLDAYCAVPKANTFPDVRAALEARIDGLPTGLYQFFFHPALETDAFKTITGSWQQRVWEGELFSDPAMKSYLAAPANKIVLTDWPRLLCRWNCVPCDTDSWVPPTRCTS